MSGIRPVKGEYIMKIRTLISTLLAAAIMAAAGTAAASAESTAPSGGIVISGDDIRSAFDTDGTNTKAYVTFRELGTYELQFNFKLAGGMVKTYTVLSNRTKDLVAYVPMQDMLDKLKFTAADVTDLTVNGPSLKDVTAISLSLTVPTKTTTSAPAAAPLSPAGTEADKNPATGSKSLAATLAMASLSGAVVVGSLKLRRKMTAMPHR